MEGGAEGAVGGGVEHGGTGAEVADGGRVFIVHDLNPRAMSPKVRGFEPAQSWSRDFTHITMASPA